MTRVFKGSPEDSEYLSDTRRVAAASGEATARRLEEEARVRAAELEEAGRRKGEALRAEGQRQGIEEGFRAGYARGHEHGIKQGLIDAQAKVAVELGPLAVSLEGLLRSVDEQHQAFTGQLRRDLVDLAVRIAAKVLQAEVEIDPRVIERSLDHALDLASPKADLVIQANPRDLERIAEYLPSLHGRLNGLSVAAVRGDESIEPGGCRIRCCEGVIDADLLSQLDVIRRALLVDSACAVGSARTALIPELTHEAAPGDDHEPL
ncbi:MAG: hypothetical protein HZA54_04370 [Planctomycetes bacterium]|nr:hypothetical protein [Planctomycetota bacterium]